ncbi:MAG: TolC family protein, partial [Candidatus Brocadiales bacterium]
SRQYAVSSKQKAVKKNRFLPTAYFPEVEEKEMKKFLPLTIFCLTVLFPLVLHAEGVEFQSQMGFLKLSLMDCIEIAFRNNLDVEIARLNPRIEEKDISVARARFDPVFKASGEMRKDEDPFNFLFAAGAFPPRSQSLTYQKTMDASITSLVPTGATLSIEYENSRKHLKINRVTTTSTFINPFWETAFEAKISQPLLKGGGVFYNMSPIYIARNDKRKSVYAFRRTLGDVANATQKAYWGLVKAIEDLKAAHKSLQRAEEFLHRNKLQVEAGLLASIEVVAAEEEVASRQEAIIVAENEVRNKEDNLKQLMNFLSLEADPVLMDITITPLDIPQFLPKKINLENSLRVAQERRPELFENRLTLENAEITLKQKKNELLPKLDLEGGVRYEGLGNRWHDSQESTLTSDYQGEYAKLTLEIPIGLRAERANYARARFSLRQAELELKKIEQDVLVQVRAAVRQVHTNVERVEATRKTRELAQRRLEAEERKFNVGRSTSLEVLRAQEELTNAETNESKAITDYQISLGELEASKGTILEFFGVVIDGEL